MPLIGNDCRALKVSGCSSIRAHLDRPQILSTIMLLTLDIHTSLCFALSVVAAAALPAPMSCSTSTTSPHPAITSPVPRPLEHVALRERQTNTGNTCGWSDNIPRTCNPTSLSCAGTVLASSKAYVYCSTPDAAIETFQTTAYEWGAWFPPCPSSAWCWYAVGPAHIFED